MPTNEELISLFEATAARILTSHAHMIEYLQYIVDNKEDYDLETITMIGFIKIDLDCVRECLLKEDEYLVEWNFPPSYQRILLTGIRITSEVGYE
jgi:hypothetical protein